MIDSQRTKFTREKLFFLGGGGEIKKKLCLCTIKNRCHAEIPNLLA